MRRAEHQPGDLVDIWYDPPNKDTPGWRGPAQISSVNEDEGNITVRFQGRTLDRRPQEVRVHVPYLVYLSIVLFHKDEQWRIIQQGAECLTASFMAAGVVLHHGSWHLPPPE